METVKFERDDNSPTTDRVASQPFNDLLSDRVEYAIFLAMIPSNLVPSDWKSGAILGMGNAFRNKVKLAAKLALIEVER